MVTTETTGKIRIRKTRSKTKMLDIPSPSKMQTGLIHPPPTDQPTHHDENPKLLQIPQRDQHPTNHLTSQKPRENTNRPTRSHALRVCACLSHTHTPLSGAGASPGPPSGRQSSHRETPPNTTCGINPVYCLAPRPESSAAATRGSSVSFPPTGRRHVAGEDCRGSPRYRVVLETARPEMMREVLELLKLSLLFTFSAA